MRKRLLSGLLAVSMMFSLFPVSAFAEDTGGGISPDAVSVQEVDAENDADDTKYTKVFKVADTASEANGIVTFADAVQQINADSSGTGNYLIELADDITLKETGKYYNSPEALISANTTTILGNGHTITIDNLELFVVGSGTKVILGQSGGGNLLNFTGGSNAYSIIHTTDGSTLDIYGGVTFNNCTPTHYILDIGKSTVNLHDDVCIKGNTSQNGSNLVFISTAISNNYNAFLNMYGQSCVDGSEGGRCGILVAYGQLNMYNSSCIKNINDTYGKGIYSYSGTTVIMHDSSTIENCSRGIFACGSFTMKDSSRITSCTYTQTGSSLYGGAGVYVDTNATFTMEDNSSITNCNAYNGGAVNIYDGKFVMNGGTIANNHAKYGGGLYASNGKITSTGGTICNNTADICAADVYASAGGKSPTMT